MEKCKDIGINKMMNEGKFSGFLYWFTYILPISFSGDDYILIVYCTIQYKRHLDKRLERIKLKVNQYPHSVGDKMHTTYYNSQGRASMMACRVIVAPRDTCTYGVTSCCYSTINSMFVMPMVNYNHVYYNPNCD